MNFRRLFLLGAMVSIAGGEEWQPLWVEGAPGAPAPGPGVETSNERGWVSEVERPEYLLYQAPKDRRTGQGVVLLPGGGYSFVSMNNEGHDFAKWLNERGITAIIVKYRVSGKSNLGYEWPVPFLDARRAIRTMRSKAGEWGVNPEKVGVMGSSAGGHLAAMCATRFNDTLEGEGADAIDMLSARPDFAALIYPVISMGEFTHQGSREHLLGKDPTEEQVAELSAERQVSKQTPRCFLLSTGDDFVDSRNSLRFAMACKENGVPVTLHLFERGGHGYGLHGKQSVQGWPRLLEKWLEGR